MNESANILITHLHLLSMAGDGIGYIRYASVYEDFRKTEDFNAFLDDIKKLQSKGK